MYVDCASRYVESTGAQYVSGRPARREFLLALCSHALQDDC